MQIFAWDVYALILAFSVTPKISAEEDQGMFFRIEENAFLNNENALLSEKADSILTCAQMCRREAACKGANFLANKGTCSLFNEGQQARKMERFVKRNGSFYIEKVNREFSRSFRYHFVLQFLFLFSAITNGWIFWEPDILGKAVRLLLLFFFRFIVFFHMFMFQCSFHNPFLKARLEILCSNVGNLRKRLDRAFKVICA